jgi:UDP-N-acetyl-D-glucosamine dehydrogenase
MPHYCVQKVERALNDMGKATRGSKVAVLGVSYKPGVGDIRESPALKIVSRLQELGADVVYHDPHVPDLPSHGLSSVALESATTNADIAVIVTAHPEVDHMAVAQSVPVVDLRGVTRPPRVGRTREVSRFNHLAAPASIFDRKAA